MKDIAIINIEVDVNLEDIMEEIDGVLYKRQVDNAPIPPPIEVIVGDV